MISYSKRIVFFCVLIFAVFNSASPQKQKYKPSYKKGSYRSEYNKSVLLMGGVNYYFGDIERTGSFSLKYGKRQMKYFGYAGYTTNIYQSYVKFRVGILAGALQGDKARYSFKSQIYLPEAMVEFHPFYRRVDYCCIKESFGPYAFVGCGVALSIIKLNDISYNQVLNRATFAPLVPVAGIGGRFPLKRGGRFELGFEFGYHFVVALDKYMSNLDGYPFIRSVANYSNGDIYYNIAGEKTSKWRDSFYTFAITASYKF